MQTIDPSLLFDGGASPLDPAPQTTVRPATVCCSCQGCTCTAKLKINFNSKSTCTLWWSYFDPKLQRWCDLDPPEPELDLVVDGDPAANKYVLEISNATNGTIKVSITSASATELPPAEIPINECHQWSLPYSSQENSWEINGYLNDGSGPSNNAGDRFFTRLPDPTFKVIKAGG